MCVLCDIYKHDGLVGVELGVYRGNHAHQMLQDIPLKRLYLIDAWDGVTGESVIGGFEDYVKLRQKYESSNVVSLIRKKSVDASNDFEDNSLDFVYIDANHFYESVIEDIDAWWPKIKKGGMMCGDDVQNIILNNSHTVIHAVKDRFSNFVIVGPSWLTFKDNEQHCNVRG